MKSLWTETAALPTFPALSHDEHTDVLVIGGGIAGLVCAYYLQQAGLSVLVAEANRIGCGVTAGTTAKLTVQQGGCCYQTLIDRRGEAGARTYRRLQERALEDFDGLAQQFPCDAETVDAYLYAREDAGRLWAEQHAILQLGGEAHRSDVSLPFPVTGAVCLPRQRQFHPLKLLAGVAAELKVYEHTRIRELREQIAVTDAGITVKAKTILVATHFPFVNRYGLYPLKLYQQRSYVLALHDAPPLPGMLIDTAKNGLFFRNYEDWVLLSGAGHRTGKSGQGWEELETAAAQYFPDAEITYRWATQDCCTADGLPYIGPYASHAPNWQVVTGFNGWGMSSSLVAARLVSNSLTGQSDEGVLAPSRRVPVGPLFKNAGESVLGLLTPRVPRCRHLGCALHWNPWEHSWDCACHGSRFSRTGALEDGPATDGLRRPPRRRV